MSVLELAIGKTIYSINCNESEIEKVKRAAAKLNQKVNDLSFKLRGADEKTILMLCSMTLQDELESLKSQQPILENAQQEYTPTQNSNQNVDLINHIESANSSIENLANKIKNY